MALLSQFEPLLEHPGHVDLVRVVLSLIRTSSYGLVIAHGHAESAATWVELVAKNFPDAGRHLLLAQRHPLRATTVLTGERPRIQTRDLEDATVTTAALVRSFLRQDPDVIGVTQLDADVAPLAFTAASTGHLVLLGSAAAELESVVSALTADDERLRVHVEASVRLVAEFSLEGKLARVRYRPDGQSLVDVAFIEAGEVVVKTELLPPPEAPRPLHTARWARPLSERLPVTENARAAFVINTTSTDGPHLLGTRYAFRPSGASWPTCRDCQRPLVLIASLDLAELPAPLRTEPARAQLFLCADASCDRSSEAAAGVVAELLPRDALYRLEAPDSLESPVVSPGAMALTRVDEGPDDPLSCDKLGGWPSVPTEPELEPLFQFVEGVLLDGGTPAGWDYTEARLLPGTPAQQVIDPHEPRHVPSLLTGDAVGLLLRGPGGLVFRWATP
jgi:hypothetical protein